MAKKSQRRAVRSGKERFGCMGGLISMFDFRQGRSTQRLLADRRRGNKHAGGAGNRGNKQENTYPSETCQGTVDGEITTMIDVCKPSVKKLIEEEMSTEQDSKIENAEVEAKQCDSGHGDNRRKSHRRGKKSRKKSCDDISDVDAAEKVGSEGLCHRKSEHQAMNGLDMSNVMEELCRHIHQKSISCVEHEQPVELHMEPVQKSPGFEQKLSEAIKFLVSQKLTDENVHVEDGELRTSKDLVDALQILSSDEELFLKLLRDPNSLLVRYVQDLPDAEVKKGESKSVAGSDISKEQLINPRQSDELVNRKHHNFFRRKVRSQGRDTSNGSKISETSNKIVILKPGPAALQNPEIGSNLNRRPSTESHYVIRSNREPSEKVSSHFFLSEIKRKLKHAMGMEQQRTSIGGFSKRSSVERQNAARSGWVKEYAGMNSPTKDHFFIERIARPSTDRLKDHEINSKHETADFCKQKVSSIYIEAKKHLFEMLNNGNQNADCSSRKVQKTLGRMLSLPDYNSSPVGSPGRNRELGFLTAKMRLTTPDTSPVVNENKQHNHVSHLSQTTNNSENKQCISDDSNNNEVQDDKFNLCISDQCGNDNRMDETFCSIGDQMSSRDAVEIFEVAETIVQVECKLLDTFPEPDTFSDTRDDRNVDIGVCAEKQDPQCSKQTREEDEPPASLLASPPHSLVTIKVEYPERITDIQERPSPVSVLEPLFTEDVISPASTRSHSAETAIQPLRIQFEGYGPSPAGQGNQTKACMDNEKTVFKYIKAVLQASNLNWDELYIKSLSSDLLLDSNVLDEVEFCPNQLFHDQNLLFDCVNEVLMEICGHYMGCSPWVSFVKPNVRPIPNMKNTIQEVMDGVYWHLLPMPLSRTLDQIVKKDMGKTGTWLDLRHDTESFGVEMGEAILEDLMEEIISCTTANSEGEHSVLPAWLS
ncbi:hypothetical protein SLE2022_028330 [Rubroshorea leprosula]